MYTIDQIKAAKTITAVINGVAVKGMNLGLSTHNGKTIVDIQCVNGVERFCYINQIVSLEDQPDVSKSASNLYKPATLTLPNGERVRGEYTGYSFVLEAYVFAAYNGNTHEFQNLNLLQVDEPTITNTDSLPPSSSIQPSSQQSKGYTSKQIKEVINRSKNQ